MRQNVYCTEIKSTDCTLKVVMIQLVGVGYFLFLLLSH